MAKKEKKAKEPKKEKKIEQPKTVIAAKATAPVIVPKKKVERLWESSNPVVTGGGFPRVDSTP